MKYWAYVNNEILGPFEKEKLLELPSFAPSLLICPQTPVGEKTEDWKEAASYPEISAVMGPGSHQPAPAANTISMASAQPEPGIQSRPGIELKSLTAASVDPVPPSEHSFGQISLEVGHLERSGRVSPAAGAPAQAGSNFDPITLSSIGRKAGAGQEAGISIAREPQSALASSSPSAEPARQQEIPQASNISFSPLESAAAPAQNAGFAAPDGSALAELDRKLETLARNSATRQDMAAATEPLRMKLDQMGEVLSSMKNSQFQREIMDKLAYLDNALSDIKFSIKDGAGAGSSASQPGKLTFESPAATVFGAQPQPREEKPKPEPVAEKPKAGGIVDHGSKPSKIGSFITGFFKKLFKLVVTLVLLAAVLLVTVFALKTGGVFDATKFIPFKIPFLTSPASSATGAGASQAFETPKEPAQAQAAAQPQAAAQTEAKKEPDVSPEVIYFLRYYAPRAGGPKLEDKITEIAVAAGATYNPANWQAHSTGPDMYEASASVPAKGGNVTFTYTVDYAKKTITPSDAQGKAAYDALTKGGAPRKGGKRSKRSAAAKQAPAEGAEADAATEAPAAEAAAPKGKAAASKKARGAAAAAKKPAAGAKAKKAGGDDKDYEYVYEDEDTGQ